MQPSLNKQEWMVVYKDHKLQILKLHERMVWAEKIACKIIMNFIIMA